MANKTIIIMTIGFSLLVIGVLVFQVKPLGFGPSVNIKKETTGGLFVNATLQLHSFEILQGSDGKIWVCIKPSYDLASVATYIVVYRANTINAAIEWAQDHLATKIFIEGYVSP